MTMTMMMMTNALDDDGKMPLIMTMLLMIWIDAHHHDQVDDNKCS
jgi:hypothetical protein